MPRQFAILRIERIKEWGDFSRLVNHCERKGPNLPSNVDPNRQGKNQRFFPQAAGAASAIARWHQRVSQRQSPLLTAGDLRNIPALAYRLKQADRPPKRGQRADGVAKFIKANLSQTALDALAAHKGIRCDQNPLREALLTSLNGLLNRYDLIHDKERFDHVEIRPAAQELLRLYRENLTFKSDARVLLNRMLLEDALPGLVTPLVKYRKDGVLAVEAFMGTSDDIVFDKSQKAEWETRSLQWLGQKVGGEENIVAGADNDDETTYHLHAIAVPLLRTPKRQRLNVNAAGLMGDKKALSQMQTDYHQAVASLGLKRGLKGSQRKHIAQQRLFQHRKEVEATLESVTTAFDGTLAELQGINPFKWAANKGKIIAGVEKVMADAAQSVAGMAELAKEVLLLRRDKQEYERIFNERGETEKKLVQADESVAAEKQRADQALKDQAALVRGLDLAPIAADILALTPTVQDGKTVFRDNVFALEITGRKFRDSKNKDCRGTGAIDLVMKLTGRNFKGAVEYLLTKFPHEQIVADKVGAAKEGVEEQILRERPQPRLLTFDDLPPQIRLPNSLAWPALRSRLVNDQHLDGALLDSLSKDKLLWAVDDHTLAVSRTSLDSTKPVGVTLLDISAPELQSRVLLPEQGGYFWLGETLLKTDRAVLVANPLEALSYRRLWQLDPKGKLPQIVSIDTELPQSTLIRQIGQVQKRLVLATHTPLADEAFAAKVPELLHNGQPVDWLEFEYTDFDLPPEYRGKAWNMKLVEQIQALQRQKIWQK